MSEEILNATQELLGQIVSKTPLTTKLLAKPPFRFLHDLIMEIIRNTQFAEGLYSEEECQSGNVTEKDAKIAFLQKLVDCIRKQLASL
jgi:TRAF3-interacting protein 1